MAKKISPPNYTSAIVVVHGESENIITKHIRSSLRLNLYIHKRKTSIQVNGLLHELNTNFKNVAQLKKNPRIVLDISNKKIKDFKIFTLMDTDDCTEDIKEKYINGKLFEQYELKDYLVPIFLTPDLEHVLYESNLIPKIYNDDEKVEEYGKLFPIRNVPVGESKMPMDDMKETMKKMKCNKNTNLELFFKYCIEQAEKRRARRS